ncbi:Uncharacterized protein TPAR_08438 [Tolypocladium paradoxum]|uniref:Demethylmenaquinone methyltransferase n=1 Tax=Tolypocladium paradoxum TaxID=94208 RepID=A0A2S4KMJ6_9HYPO|nr:Uncharacterized protein TPAR_08438 [Tolypocladium paradoxum]
MAKKRRLEQQDGARQRPSTAKTGAMSADVPSPSHAPNGARRSSDGTMSEAAPSDGAQTAMTSVVDTDDENEDPNLDAEGQADDDVETASAYAVSQYPRPASPHGTAMHLYLDDVAASTRSLWVPDLDYREIHGRRYAREYYMPNDEIEQLRLSLQHQVFLHLLDGDLTCVPLDDPKFVLDVGTGTGEWPIRMAELFPHCEVVGTDISAIAETKSVPMNVFFEIEDAEEWDRPTDYYDLIHFRCMEGAFRDWRFIYDRVYDSLKPGGWIEMIDFDSLESVKIWFTAFSEGSPIFDMAGDLEIAAERVGRKRGISHMDPQLLVDAGFVDVRVTEHSIPMKVGEKSAGKLWLISCLDALEANCLRLLTQVMGWDPDECKAACEKAARELAQLAKDPEKAQGLVVKARTVAARKPMEALPRAQSPTGHARSPSAEREIDTAATAPAEPVPELEAHWRVPSPRDHAWSPSVEREDDAIATAPAEPVPELEAHPGSQSPNGHDWPPTVEPECEATPAATAEPVPESEARSRGHSQPPSVEREDDAIATAPAEPVLELEAHLGAPSPSGHTCLPSVEPQGHATAAATAEPVPELEARRKSQSPSGLTWSPGIQREVEATATPPAEPVPRPPSGDRRGKSGFFWQFGRYTARG